MSEFRTDPLFGNWCVIAREREARPHRVRMRDELDLSGPCPLCPGSEALCPPEVERIARAAAAATHGAPGHPPTRSANWQTRAFPNRYPALALEAESGHAELSYEPGKTFSTLPGFGAHEMIVESPSHTVPFWQMELPESIALFKLLQNRVRGLYKDRRLLYAQLFKNHRAAAGASIEHPHFQLIALPFVSPSVEQIILRGKEQGSCVVCGLLQEERPELSAREGAERRPGTAGEERSPRFLAETSRFIALTDFAPAYAYQFSLYSKDHALTFEAAKTEELEELIQLLSLTIGRWERLIGEIALNVSFFIEPNPAAFKKPARLVPWKELTHWFVRVQPRTARHAGFELSTGIPIIHVAPEDAARSFREKPA